VKRFDNLYFLDAPPNKSREQLGSFPRPTVTR
jgi:hypothetical protein